MSSKSSPIWQRLVVYALITALATFLFWALYFNRVAYSWRFQSWYEHYKLLIWAVGAGVLIGAVYLLGTSTCPHCKERISKEAGVCSHCGRNVPSKNDAD